MNYSIKGSQNVATSAITILGLTSASTIRPRIYHAIFGSNAAPVDIALRFLLQRYTAAGTATAVVPRPLDPDDPASLAAAGENHTVEPTYTANVILLDLPLHQKATFPWHANEGKELVLPATAANGIGVNIVHATFSGLVQGNIHYEQ